jgi:hypothetical protein
MGDNVIEFGIASCSEAHQPPQAPRLWDLKVRRHIFGRDILGETSLSETWGWCPMLQWPVLFVRRTEKIASRAAKFTMFAALAIFLHESRRERQK